MPPAVVFGHSGFLHPAQHARPPGGVHLFHYAADLARSPDGNWWVVGDRTQAPSGAGYALENRLIVSRVFPQMFRDLHVQHLASFFDAWRESLRRWAPKGDGAPLIVLLTPGPYNETYFEHALLARYLGFPLVEGSDLTVRDGRVWMKTVEGLKRVHALLRRQDDDYCDPLELRSDSALGVPGLTDCARRGTVLLANALGSGVLESGGLLAYLPELSRAAARRAAEAAVGGDLVARRAGRLRRRLEATRPPDDQAARTLAVGAGGVRRRPGCRPRAPDCTPSIALRPQRYIAQEWVHVSQAPVLERSIGPAVAARAVARPHGRPARLRGGHAGRLPGHAGRPGPGGR